MYQEREAVIVPHDKYIMAIREHMKTRRIVYLDESYIHQNYNKRHDDSLHDPADTRLVPKGARAQAGTHGARCCGRRDLPSGRQVAAERALQEQSRPLARRHA